MIQRDFIKRQIEELGRAIGKVISDILKLQERGKLNEGVTMSQEILKSSFDLNIEKILSLQIENFIETILSDTKLSPVHLNSLGDLIYVTAGLFEQKREPENAKKMYQKVLLIFKYVDQTEKTFSVERNNKIKVIEKYLGIINLRKGDK